MVGIVTRVLNAVQIYEVRDACNKLFSKQQQNDNENSNNPIKVGLLQIIFSNYLSDPTIHLIHPFLTAAAK